MGGRLGLSVRGSAVTGMHGLGTRWQGGGACAPGHLENNLLQTLALKAGAGFSLAAGPFQLLPLLFADWKPPGELPASSIATRRVEDSVFQRAPNPAPVSSPEMPQIGEKPPIEPQNRYGAGYRETGEATH